MHGAETWLPRRRATFATWASELLPASGAVTIVQRGRAGIRRGLMAREPDVLAGSDRGLWTERTVRNAVNRSKRRPSGSASLPTRLRVPGKGDRP
jgi:hypothetical protein